MAKKSMIAKAKRTPKLRGPRLPPLLRLRPAARLHAPLRAVPHLLPGARPAGRAAGRHEVELVGTDEHLRSHRGHAHPHPQRLPRAPHRGGRARLADQARDRPHPQGRGLHRRRHRGAGRARRGPAHPAQVRRRQGARRVAASSASASPACGSTPRKTDIPRVLGGLGIVIVSTSQGIMTGAAGPQGPAGRRSPGVRLVGRPCHVSDACPSPSPPASTSTIDGRTRHGQGPQGHARAATLAPGACASSARTARCVVERPTEQKTPQRAPRPDPHAGQQHGRRRDRRLPQGPRDHRRRLPRPARRPQAPAQPGLQPPDRDRPARRASASRSRTRPGSRSSASTRSSSARSPPASARPASPSPTRARASATPARSIRRKAGKAGKIGGKK